MKKNATARSAEATSRQSTLNFPTSSEADLVAESSAAVTSTKSGAKNRGKRTADFADKPNNPHCDSSAISAQSAVKTQTRNSTNSMPSDPTELPKPWHWGTLGDILKSIDTGKSFRCEERPPNSDETGVIKVSAVTWGTYDESESKTCVDASRINEQYLVNQGDFLFSRANTIQLIGACVIADNVTHRMMLSDKILRFRFKSDILPKWALYWLRSTRGHREIERLSTGNQESMRNIGQDRIRQIQIPLAPLPEQHRIVAEIEKQFTRLDAGVAALKRVQANLKRYRAAVLKAACEGHLVPTEAELAREEGRNFQTGEALLARIRRMKAEKIRNGEIRQPRVIDPSFLTEPNETIPEGWTFGRVEDFGAAEDNAIVDGPFGSNLKLTDYTPDGKYPVITITNIDEGFDLASLRKVTKEKFEEVKRSAVRAGDILVAKIGSSFGKTGIYPSHMPVGIIPANLLKVTPAKQMDWRYLYYHLRSHAFKKHLDTIVQYTAQPAFNVSKFKLLPVPVPPLPEQTRIVTELDRRFSVVEKFETVISTNLRRASRLRQSILHKAMNGEL